LSTLIRRSSVVVNSASRSGKKIFSKTNISWVRSVFVPVAVGVSAVAVAVVSVDIDVAVVLVEILFKYRQCLNSIERTCGH